MMQRKIQIDRSLSRNTQTPLTSGRLGSLKHSNETKQRSNETKQNINPIITFYNYFKYLKT